MLDIVRGQFRKIVFKTYRYLKHPRRLKHNALLRWFARHFLDKRVWKPTQHTFAGGMAVGLLVTMQLLPGQMPLAIILAAACRVNIPIAVAVCWLSNPATFVPIGVFEKEVGERILQFFGDPTAHWISLIQSEGLRTGVAYAHQMFIGGLVIGALLAPAGYVLTYVLWGLLARLAPQVLHVRAKPAALPAAPHV
jgi:hypothetical protein